MNSSHRFVMETVARPRAEVYALLLRIFARLPDRGLLEELASQGFRDFLSACCATGTATLREGAALVEWYFSDVLTNHEEKWVLNDLSVDRTRLLRAPWGKGLRPPYEHLYLAEGDRMATIHAVTDSYRKAGLLPEDGFGDSPDYLGVELDFVYQLSLTEVRIHATGQDPASILEHQHAFLVQHLGRWVGDFCREAKESAGTALYQGFLGILEAFIAIEMEYLRNAVSAVSQSQG
jgi:TorA maturation chaperone TorD